MVTIEIGPFVFCAAHMGVHDGRFEALHGHTFTVTLRLAGSLDGAGMLLDFRAVKTAVAEVIAPLRRRTLISKHPPGGSCTVEDGQMVAECGGRRYSLPAADVVLLPVANTSTEALAEHLLGQILPCVGGTAGVERAELMLAEAPDTAAIVTAAVAHLDTRLGGDRDTGLIVGESRPTCAGGAAGTGSGTGARGWADTGGGV